MKFTKSLIAAAALGTLFVGTANAENFGVGTMSQGTITYSAGAAISKVVSKTTDFQLRVQPFSGTTQVVPQINNGEMDFGLANVIETSAAVDGRIVFEGRPNPNLRVVAVIFPLRVGFFVRKYSEINSFKDLRGRSLPVDYASQAMINSVTNSILAAGGISTDDVEGVPVPNIARAADDFATGKTDAFFFGIGAGKVAQVSAKVDGLRLLPIDDNDASLSAARNHASSVYITTVKPTERTVGVEQPTPAITYDYLLLAGKHVSDDVVYAVTKALHDNKKSLIRSFGIFRGFHADKMAKNLPVKYHAGAVRFYKEAGLLPQ
ncbi:MAG: TAXI family TRAP transporter solute-binding subunit [Sneathiella sp.]|nr:TAXI family TRAP transporter solute-binding subunit [Sneathiella sp.]